MSENNQSIILFLRDAIRNHNTINFMYEGKHRIVNPHFVGLNGGIQQLHAFQIGGESTRGGLPQWRNFRIEDILNFRNNRVVFDAPSRGYNPKGTKYTRIDFEIEVIRSPRP